MCFPFDWVIDCRNFHALSWPSSAWPTRTYVSDVSRFRWQTQNVEHGFASTWTCIEHAGVLHWQFVGFYSLLKNIASIQIMLREGFLLVLGFLGMLEARKASRFARAIRTCVRRNIQSGHLLEELVGESRIKQKTKNEHLVIWKTRTDTW